MSAQSLVNTSNEVGFSFQKCQLSDEGSKKSAAFFMNFLCLYRLHMFICLQLRVMAGLEVRQKTNGMSVNH